MPRGRRRSAYRVIAWTLTVSLLAACAGQPFKPESDEVKLWAAADKEEQQLLKKTKPYDDPLLDEYLARIGDRLRPDEVRPAGVPGLRFGVISDPTLNAFAMPNGRIYVHSGLLSRIDNEAQLAMILGHEMTHVDHRHALRFERDAVNKQILFPVGAAVLSQTASAILGGGLPLAATAAINGYGRDLEREADEEGMARLVRAGYDPKEAPKVFALLQADSKDRGSLETFFFGSHPRLQERIETTNRLIQTSYGGAAASPTTITNSEEFGLRMRTVLRENALLDIRAGRFKLAEDQLARVMAITPKDPLAHLYVGDLYRLQAQRARAAEARGVFARKALDAYERSAELDPAFPDPFRQLGFLYYQQKENDRAREAFKRYLALKPDAPDGGRIKEYLVELDR
jgi:predicted Zn-dependent protease